MTAEDSIEPGFTDIDKALSAWRQGDCVLGLQWFVHRMVPERPSTQAGSETAKLDATADLVEQQVVGLVVVTQTCDVVRACADRPFIEVCPLVEVDEQRLSEIERERRPSYAYVALLAGQKLVADLDRTMTVEKPVVAKWERTPGWRTDAEARAFAKALARKRARFAFPDDFTALMGKLQSRLSEKHSKDTPEGRALRSLREIRVQASPSWDAAVVTLTFWFIRYDDQVECLGSSWSNWAETWLKLVPESRRYTKVLGQVVAGEDGGPVQSRRFIASGHRRGKPHMLTSPNRDITASVVVLLILLAVLSLLTHCGGFDCPFGTVRVPDPVAGFRCEPAPRGEAACDGQREVCE